jgi:anion-transporting  ArsA/GET3 family ATPase
MLSELGTFLKAFSTLFAGFQERAGKVRELMTSDVTTFTVITAPTAGNIDEAIYFHKKLGADHARVGGFVTNRVHPAWVPRAELSRPSGQLSRELSGLSQAYDALDRDAQKEFARKIRSNATDFQVLADLDAEAIELLRDTIPRKIPILRVPYFAHDIHSLAGLDHVRRSLFVA